MYLLLTTINTHTTGKMNSGLQRSLTLKVVMKLNGVPVPGYPHIYQGRNAFTHPGTGIEWPAISAEYMAVMELNDFNARLADFNDYVQQLEFNLSVEDDLIPGADARRENTTACPI